MAQGPHLVKVPKEGADREASDRVEASSGVPPAIENVDRNAMTVVKGRRNIPTKVLAVAVAAILIGAGGIFVWAKYLRPWTTADIEEQVIPDPTDNTPGFRHSLAGRTVTVEGKISAIKTRGTTLGDVSFIWTTSSGSISLVHWGETAYEVGDKIKMKVHFEWSYCNDERHVYSPQISFPWMYLPEYAVLADSLSWMMKAPLIPEELDNGTVRMVVFDEYPALSLSSANCSLRAGISSGMDEYMQLAGIWDYGRDIDFVSNLSEGTSENGLISYVDLDDDGYVTAGDYFDLTGLERPAEDSGTKTYLLYVGRTNVTDSDYIIDVLAGVSYLVMTNKGLLRYTYSATEGTPIAPYARGSVSVSGNEVTVTCDRLMTEVSWDDIEIEMCNQEYVSWYPSAGNLDDDEPSTENLGSELLGPLAVSCTVIDLAGNGYLDEGDYFVITASGDFPSPDDFEVISLFEPSSSSMFRVDFST